MAKIKKAKNLSDVINIFNPKEPLKSQEELKHYYVERENSPKGDMKTLLLESKKNLKLLFTGHRGSGKSTEINKLLSEPRMKDKFIAISFSSLEALNPTDMTHLDILLTILGRIIQTIKEKEQLEENEKIGKIIEDCEKWIEGLEIERIVEKKKGKGILGRVHLFFVDVEAGMRTDTIVRESVRKKITPSEVLDYIFIITQQIEVETGKKVLIVTEDLDKCDEGMMRKIFKDYSATLSEIKLPFMIYSFPINLRYSSDFMVIRNSFTQSYELPDIKLKERASKEIYKDGFNTMKKVISNRMESNLMDSEGLNLAVEMSGGNIIYLIQLVSGAAILAKQSETNRKKEIIKKEDVLEAVKKLRRDFQGMLSENDINLIKKYNNRIFSSEQEILHLLQNTSLLLYINDEFWTSAHPIVGQLMKNVK